MSPRWKKFLRLAAFLAAILFLIVLVRSQWQALQSFEWSISYGWLAASLILLELAWLFELSIWRAILASLGGQLRWRRAAETWFLSNIIRYIPGNIWQFLGMAELAADDGVSRITTLSSIVLHQALSTAVGIVLAAIYFAVAGQTAWLEALRPLLLLAPLGLLLCHPRLLSWALNTVFRRLGRPPVQITLTWRQIWLILAGYLGVWLVMGSAFALLARALTPLASEVLPALVATWAAAYVAGYLSLLTPSGLGVREGVMVLLLTPLLPEPLPVVIALSARLWMILGELLGAGAALISRRAAPPARAPLLAKDVQP